MQDYQHEFIEYALSQGVLQFGQFTLKSGRISPYFFNSGLFNNGESLGELGNFYARTIMESGLEFDMLFGPAYKGIPLVCTVSIALSRLYGHASPYCFDRKEVKDHGEGGMTVGAPLQGRVIIIDDVISAGTSVNYCFELIRRSGATPIAAAIALDRQELGLSGRSSIEEIEQKLGISVLSIIKLEDMINYLKGKPDKMECLDRINQYRDKYGIN